MIPGGRDGGAAKASPISKFPELLAEVSKPASPGEFSAG
jgi:hypothetical protein